MTSLSTGHSVETRLVLERLRRIVGGGGTRADALPRGTDARGTARATAGPLSSRRKAQRGAWLPSRRGAVCPDRTPPHRISLEPPLAILCGLVAWFAFGGVVSAGRLLRMINWLVGEMQSFVDVCVCALIFNYKWSSTFSTRVIQQQPQRATPKAVLTQGQWPRSWLVLSEKINLTLHAPSLGICVCTALATIHAHHLSGSFSSFCAE